MIFGDFHDHGVKVWVQGAFESVFRVVSSPDFYFFGRIEDQVAPGAVARFRRGESDNPQKSTGKMNARGDTGTTTVLARIHTRIWTTF